MIHFVVIEQKNQQETLSRSFPKIKRILRASLPLFFTRKIIGVSIRHPVYNMADRNGYITLK